MENHRDPQTKELVIPDNVPAVIETGDKFCKALSAIHGVRFFVDRDKSKVVLKRDESNIKGAEDNLAKRFASSKISKSRENTSQRSIHTVKLSTMWSFEKENYITSDVEVKQHIFRLQQVGQEVTTTSSNKDWIKQLCEFEDEANNLKRSQPQSPVKSKVSFGKLCFKPMSSRFPGSTLPLNKLQELQIKKDFDMRWTNVCVRTPSFQTTLLNELEEKMDKDTISYSTMLVYLVDCTGKQRKEYDLKYHLVDKQWKLHNVHARRNVRSRFDVFVNNDTSFRVRSVTREKTLDNIVKCLERLVVLSIPNNGNFFDTKVTLRRTAPRGLSLKWAVPKLKVSMEITGLCFTIAYLDQRRNEFRLECRLPRAEQDNLNMDERSVLLKKVIQLFCDDNI